MNSNGMRFVGPLESARIPPAPHLTSRFSFFFYFAVAVYSLVTFRGTTQAESTTPGLTGNFSEVAKLLVKVRVGWMDERNHPNRNWSATGANFTGTMSTHQRYSRSPLLFAQKLPPSNTKLSYIYDAFMFHYIVENQWIYLCICDEKYQRMLAFQFLNEILAFVKSQ